MRENGVEVLFVCRSASRKKRERANGCSRDGLLERNGLVGPVAFIQIEWKWLCEPHHIMAYYINLHYPKYMCVGEEYSQLLEIKTFHGTIITGIDACITAPFDEGGRRLKSICIKVTK